MSPDQTATFSPPDISTLQEIFGGPDVHGMGSSVVSLTISPPNNDVDLESLAKIQYQEFCGEIWNRFGPENWLAPWSELYRRPYPNDDDDLVRNILDELRGLKDDHCIDLVVSMMLENIDDAKVAHAALSQVFDDPAIQQLSIYRLGDGEAYNGLLIAATTHPATMAGEDETTVQAIFLTFLMD